MEATPNGLGSSLSYLAVRFRLLNALAIIGAVIAVTLSMASVAGAREHRTSRARGAFVVAAKVSGSDVSLRWTRPVLTAMRRMNFTVYQDAKLLKRTSGTTYTERNAHPGRHTFTVIAEVRARRSSRTVGHITAVRTSTSATVSATKVHKRPTHRSGSGSGSTSSGSGSGSTSSGSGSTSSGSGSGSTSSGSGTSSGSTSTVPENPTYWGAWIGSQFTGTPAPWDMTAVSDFETLADKHLSLVNFSSPFYDCTTTPCTPENFPEAPFNNLYAQGIIPFFSWNSASLPVTTDEPNFTLADVANGDYDSYIRSWATAAAAWGHPFFLRFDWEMNGSWFPWGVGVNGNTAAEYVAAWRHVYDIFQSVGATNVTWVWCPNIDPTNSLAPLASLYPGNAYVNWTGLDGYNEDDPWTSFSSLFSSTYQEITQSIAPGKPLMIAEVGSTETGGSKADWIQNMFSSLASGAFSDVRGLMWYDESTPGYSGLSDWPIESSTSATAAFAAGISNPAFLSSAGSSTGLADLQPIGAPS
ncbi:MAG: glycoside hydrolase family 26 protein [Solirubrobacteraceae bacterium]